MTTMGKPDILLIEDSEAHAELVRRSLADMGGELSVVPSLAAARIWLATHDPTLVLSDLQLPDGTAINLLADYSHGVPWPLIVMTGHGDETLAVSSIKAGALDYVVKSPESIRHMPRTIERAMREWGRMLEHRSTQKALLASEERLRLAMEATSDGLWDWDLTTDQIYWSARSYTMLGYHPQQFTVNYAVWLELLHPEDRARIAEQLLLQIRNQGFFSLEYRLRTQEGGWRWVNGRGKPVSYDANHHMVRVVGTHVDIHERVQSEQRLQESKKRFELLFEHAKDAIFVADAKTGTILEVNSTAERMLGRPRSELVGLNSVELHPAEMREHYRKLFEQAAEGSMGKMDVLELQAADGRRIPTEVASSSIVLPSGQVVVQGVFRDVSDRLQLEAQLRQAQKMEAIGQLAGGVAHDFNNVLAAIMLQISMLQSDRRMPSEVHSSLTLLEASTKRAADLTRQLLLFGRRQPAKMQPVDMDALVANLLKMLRRLIGETIQLEFTPVANRHWVNADSGMMEQVLMNLVVNARDAMPQGGRIAITVESLASASLSAKAPVHGLQQVERYLCLTVTDTGTGIDADTLKRLFEPFFTTKPQGKGTGLGLATAYSILKTHQGWIEVESEPGRGSSFRVYLPMIAAPRSVVKPMEHVPAPPAPRGAVLLVEDDQLVRTFTSLSLKSAGYPVIEAADGRAALALWKNTMAVVELVLTDMVMPSGLNGWDVVAAVRQDKPRLPAVIMSGYASDLPAAALKPETGVVFLQKPFDTPKLVMALRNAIANMRG
jgi:PAS domain S-box-containing protein